MINIDNITKTLIKVGLIIDGKPCSFKQFKELADVHCYGRGKNSQYRIYFGNKPYLMFFEPMYENTKTQSIKAAYTLLKNFIDSDFDQCEDEVYFSPNGVGLTLIYYNVEPTYNELGQLHGVVTYYDPTNTRLTKKSNFVNGKEHGEFIRYFEDGSIKTYGYHFNDLTHGKWIWFYPNGQIKEIVNYRDGLMHGLCETYYEDGILANRGYWNMNRKFGYWKWDETKSYHLCLI